MERANDSAFHGFILLGFSNQPSWKASLFNGHLIIYFLSCLGNGAIILLSAMDPHLHTLCASSSPTSLLWISVWLLALSLRPWPTLRGRTRPSPMAAVWPALHRLGTWGSRVCPPVCHGLWPVCSCVRPLHYMVIVHPQLCLQLVVTVAYRLWQFCSPDSTDHDSSPLW